MRPSSYKLTKVEMEEGFLIWLRLAPGRMANGTKSYNPILNQLLNRKL